jgi:hypothetical protein
MPARLQYSGRYTQGAQSVSVDTLIEFHLPLSSQLALLPAPTTATFNYVYVLPNNCQLLSDPPNGSLNFVFFVNTFSATTLKYPNDLFELNGSGIDFGRPIVQRCRLSGFDNDAVALPMALPLFPLFGNQMRAFNGYSHSFDAAGMGHSRTLNLACNVQQSGGGVALPISVFPPDGQPWPLLFDHTKSDAEIAALKEVPGGFNAGLTQFHRNTARVRVNWAGDPPNFGSGACFWATDITVTFGQIQMYIDESYSEDSCEYKATLEHENKHYKAISDIIRVYQDYIVQNLNMMDLPTKGYPAFAGSFDAATDRLGQLIDKMVRSAVATMMDQLDEETRLLERETAAVHAKCDHW